MRAVKSYLIFEELLPSPYEKTKYWNVISESDNYKVGCVAWLGKWRCYAFYPSIGTVFERRCLRDIANFCEEETILHKKGWKK